jgi:hypothetical protein
MIAVKRPAAMPTVTSSSAHTAVSPEPQVFTAASHQAASAAAAGSRSAAASWRPAAAPGAGSGPVRVLRGTSFVAVVLG